MLKRPVEGAFGIVGENAGRKLPAFQMVAYAIAAYPLARTGVIAAVTGLQNLFLFAFHDELL